MIAENELQFVLEGGAFSFQGASGWMELCAVQDESSVFIVSVPEEKECKFSVYKCVKCDYLV